MARRSSRLKKSRKKRKKRSRWQEIGQPAVIVGIILSVTLAFYAVVYDPLKPVGEVAGELIARSSPRGGVDITAPVILTVRLDSGDSVQLPSTGLGDFEIGRRVILKKLRSRLLGRTEYKFIGYSEPAATP
jgi:hypothetical protein